MCKLGGQGHPRGKSIGKEEGAVLRYWRGALRNAETCRRWLTGLAQKYTAHNPPGKLLGYMQNKVPSVGSTSLGADLRPALEGA